MPKRLNNLLVSPNVRQKITMEKIHDLDDSARTITNEGDDPMS